MAKYKIKKATSMFRGQCFFWFPRDRGNDTQCSFYRLIGAPPAWATPDTTNSVQLYCLRCGRFHLVDERCTNTIIGAAHMLYQQPTLGMAHIGA